MMLWNRLRVMQGIRSVQSGQCVHGMRCDGMGGLGWLGLSPFTPPTHSNSLSRLGLSGTVPELVPD